MPPVEGPIRELSWFWIGLMAVGPTVLGTLVAAVLWRSRQMVLGNLAGTLVIFGAALVLIVRESGDLDRLTRACIAAGYTCWPEPSAFMRYAIYASIGLVEVIALFLGSLEVERRVRNRGYAPEWRR